MTKNKKHQKLGLATQCMWINTHAVRGVWNSPKPYSEKYNRFHRNLLIAYTEKYYEIRQRLSEQMEHWTNMVELTERKCNSNYKKQDEPCMWINKFDLERISSEASDRQEYDFHDNIEEISAKYTRWLARTGQTYVHEGWHHNQLWIGKLYDIWRLKK